MENGLPGAEPSAVSKTPLNRAVSLGTRIRGGVPDGEEFISARAISDRGGHEILHRKGIDFQGYWQVKSNSIRGLEISPVDKLLIFEKGSPGHAIGIRLATNGHCRILGKASWIIG